MNTVHHDEAKASSQASGSSPPTVGPQDCPTCVKRRIRCDRSLPKCLKCSKKGLVCPGYGPRLRWANGIAVRGHLKGRTTPHIDKPPPKPSSTASKDSTSPKSVKSPEQNSTVRPAPFVDPLETLFPGFPDLATRLRLLEHYDKQIAGLMVWIDSEKNEYRRLVLPLADQQPVLLLAILAISAQHLAVTTGKETSFPARARDAAVTMISKQIQQVTGQLAAGFDLSSQIDADTAVWMLASMLTLANYEMTETETGAAAADSHRQAARTLVNALATTNRENNALFHFLRNQLSIYDILACTTIFGPLSTVEVILPAPDHSNLIFSEFLSLLHRVTVWSRERPKKASPGNFNLADLPITSADARAGFEQARGSTLMAAGVLELPRDARRRDFVRIVDIYHHAALLYTYRVLFRCQVEPVEVDASTMVLFERLNQLEDKPSCLQNLPWPVFIAGTECCDDPERQAFVAKTYADIAQDMGFKYYLGILHFLQDLWSNKDTTWTELACRYEAGGKKIVAV
ncbi:uncharacterized protein PV07_10568 [Cladophialophora immunda]|uniref:Zn(2)-C6 fungal-type domain-containing protein n=1 Tax=Cladophialophora immunda TaxID=569365 RepID=A0A0D1ZAZ6_9EURO|nr:uncharacterized protein PV07_10568 [Cladophialophora immunda]KIW24881.1 hypothetical protein PV07_10568 [Cladophialophora immunda]OQU97791.1 Fungal specific transcription factor domain-containing protein [Cladophialophora immunda]